MRTERPCGSCVVGPASLTGCQPYDDFPRRLWPEAEQQPITKLHDACVASGKFKGQIEDDRQMGQKAGVIIRGATAQTTDAITKTVVPFLTAFINGSFSKPRPRGGFHRSPIRTEECLQL